MTRAAVGSSILTLKSSHGRSARANEVSQLNSAMNPRDGGLPSSAKGVRREKAALSSGCKSHPATAPAGSNRSSHGGNEMAEASG
jgi:hypothetical protein